MNPIAIALWAFLGLVGFLFGGFYGCLIGVTCGLGWSLIVTFLGR